MNNKIKKIRIKTHKSKKTKRIYEPVKNVFELCDVMKKHNDKIAFSYFDKPGSIADITYFDFQNQVFKTTAGLEKSGLAGKKIAIIGDTSPMWVCIYLSILASGGVAIPLDKELDIEEIGKFMTWVQADAIAFTPKFKDKIVYLMENNTSLKTYIPFSNIENFDGDSIISLDTLLETGEEEVNNGFEFKRDIDIESMQEMLFTSGTTGTSKCVMLSQKNIFSCVISAVESVDFNPDDVLLSILPIHHTYELAIILAELVYGIKICVNDSLRHIMQNLQTFKPTGLTLVPLIVETMHQKIWSTAKRNGSDHKLKLGMMAASTMKKAGLDFRKKIFANVIEAFGGRLKKIVCGGAALDPLLIEAFENFGISIYEGYGITECSPLAAVTPYYARKYGSVGPSVPCCQARIMGTGIGDFGYLEGEIQIKGDNVMLGYYDNDKANTLAFTEDGWFKTGDLGYIDDDGYIFITGRLKSVIVLNNGKNVFPEELEEYLSHISKIKECVVVGRADYNENVVITAVIYPNYEEFKEGVTEEEIIAELSVEIDKINRKLPIFKRIIDIDIRDTEFEKTTSKKIKRHLVS